MHVLVNAGAQAVPRRPVIVFSQQGESGMGLQRHCLCVPILAVHAILKPPMTYSGLSITLV